MNPRIAKLARPIALALLAILGSGLLAAVVTYYYLAPDLPDVAALRDIRMQVPLRVYSRDGRLLAQIGEQRRIPVQFEAIPQSLVNAFLAAEDDRFFTHGGIDVGGLLRALIVTAASGEARQGGSTITMQLARNMYLSPEKHLSRKLREILLALRIESAFSKKDILTLYLNKIFLGERAYGVAAAAEVYYGKQLDQLTIAEIATIAGLPKAPSVLNPIANPERAQQRRAYVLRRMLDKGYITKRDHDLALAAPIETQEHSPRVEVDAPYVAEMVRTELTPYYGDDLYTAGYQVITTIDSRLQRTAVWSLRSALLEYDRRHGWRGAFAHTTAPLIDPSKAVQLLDRFSPVGGLLPAIVTQVDAKSAQVWTKSGHRYALPWPTALAWAHRVDSNGRPQPGPKQPSDVITLGDIVYIIPNSATTALLAQAPIVQGSFVSLDPQDGAITALVGGFDFYTSHFNRTIQAKRQPGSSFKPFIYSGALEHGFTPASIILDGPIVIEGGTGEDSWRPENDSKRFYGPTPLRDALAHSRNLVSIRILRALGIEYGLDYAARFGFKRDDLPHNLTLTLGTAQLTPLEIARGYAVFANGGFRVTPYLIQRVDNAHGKTVMAADPLIACLECNLAVEPPLETTDLASVPPAIKPAQTAQGRLIGGSALNIIGSTDTSSVSGSVTPNAAGVTRMSDLLIPISPPQPRRLAPHVISTANAFVMTDLLRDVIRKGTGRRALTLKRDDIAGKTGTTNDRRDTWFTGFNADIVAGAWVGFDQERSLGANEEGGHTALPMWVYFMGKALAGRPDKRLVQPDGVISARVIPTTGELARSGDADGVFEYFLAGKLPPSNASATATSPGPRHNKQAEESIF